MQSERKDKKTKPCLYPRLKLRHIHSPSYIVCNDVHKFQSGPDKKDDIFDISRGKPPILEGEHLFHFMFLNTP